MPTYEYKCEPCRAIYRVSHGMSEKPTIRCPECKEVASRMISAPNLSLGLAGLSRLSLWWIKLGITPERIAPGKPQQNGRHERFHLTLKQDTARPPAATLGAQQRRFDRFRTLYNGERPHEALEQRTPAEFYAPSPRPYPERVAQAQYDESAEVRRVRSNGEIKWQGEHVFVSEVLTGELIALSDDEDGWLIHCYHLPIARLDARTRKVVPIRKACGSVDNAAR